MYLKSLTVLGFKSFADKTTLNFQRGTTAIVGPNGCGKSNVSDAIRWVLGEQSAKALRGGEMADVIFNGTDSRKPTGMAEVSLTIGDVDTAHLKAAGVAVEFNEVTVTRRVFRDGGSEYFVNKVGCRLRDIQQLFAGTGVGKTSYSVMAQGNITQILSSRPDDRRLVFEEAAGITLFKQQKREALRKLEHTDQNLLRVEDLIREVKRQIGSLQRQAGKARRYKAIAQELQHLETQWARHQFDVWTGEIEARTTEASALAAAMEAAQERVLRAEDEILHLRAALTDLDQEISAAQQRGLGLKAEAERHDNRIQVDEERIRDLETQNERALHDVAEADERRRIAVEELAGVQQRLAESQDRVAGFRGTLQERQDALGAVEQELSRHQESLRQAQSHAFAAAQQLSRARNEITQVDLQKQGNAVRLEKLRAEQGSLTEESARLHACIEEFQAQVETGRLQAQTTRGTLEERQQRLRTIQLEIQQAQQELDGFLRRQAETRSRLQVLEQLDAQHEGFSEGTLTALRQSADVLGSLTDRIRVSDAHVPAVEAALGHHLQLVLTGPAEAATAVLSGLHAARRGRASVAALQLLGAVLDPGEVGESAELPAGARPLLPLVDVEPEVRPLLQALLGRTLLVDDLAAACAGQAATGGRFDWVTPAGDLLTRNGIFTGGSAASPGKAPASILGRKNQIAELQAALTQVTGDVTEAGRRKGALLSEQTALQAGLEEVRTELRTAEMAIAAREGEFRALEGSRRSLGQKLETVAYELQTLTTHDIEGTERRQQLASEIAVLESAEQAATAQVAGLSEGLESLRQRRDAAGAAVSDARVALATEEQVLGAHGRQRPPLEARIRELTVLGERLRQQLEGFTGRRTQFEAEIADSRRELVRLASERAAVAAGLAELTSRRALEEAGIGEREEALRADRTRHLQAQTRRGQLEVELTQKAMAVENLRERILSRHQVRLEDIRGEGIRITDASEGPARVETVSLEDMAAAGLSTDWDAVARQVAELQRRLDDLGPVNLVAIEEYEEIEQRHAFLTSQHEDLVRAKTELVQVLQRINMETKTLFVDTFERIRENFRTMFVELFGGGRADLRLVEGEDPLEAGIEIVARPPGKQLQSISLLSGGEQTMTAVALLFAIYQVKPSPFCVLDELDAPLDESNINRFVDMLRRFAESSQFIIITHNKRTISMADILYGVTMQERGVSRIVSVRFSAAEGAPENRTETRVSESAGLPLESAPLVDDPDAEVMLAK
ncbi:MAG: chromosome segregation protein SMC [Verrucomicrobiae bacterium]|nr:chromosome segregation protein SMC [Verrucomicrobiae bacterium]